MQIVRLISAVHFGWGAALLVAPYITNDLRTGSVSAFIDYVPHHILGTLFCLTSALPIMIWHFYRVRWPRASFVWTASTVPQTFMLYWACGWHISEWLEQGYSPRVLLSAYYFLVVSIFHSFSVANVYANFNRPSGERSALW